MKVLPNIHIRKKFCQIKFKKLTSILMIPLLLSGFIPDISFYGETLNIPVNEWGYMKDENNEWNTIYVSAYLTYFWDTWKSKFPSLKKRPDIWASLYNLGHEKTKPNSTPKANKFGKHAAKYYDMMYLLLYR